MLATNEVSSLDTGLFVYQNLEAGSEKAVSLRANFQGVE